MSGILHYSVGTEETGKALANVLGYNSCKKSPAFSNFGVYIGWGSRRPKGWDRTGVDRLVSTGKLRILNHPSAIFENRDKIFMLKRLSEANLGVPGFIPCPEGRNPSGFHQLVERALSDGIIAFPILGLTRKNRGIPYWCFVEEDITPALAAAQESGTNIDYFRSFAPGIEYRVHVLRDEVILAQTKVQAGNPLEACVGDMLERIKFLREKEGASYTASMASTVDWVVRQLAPEMLQGPNHISRSLRRGWELQDTDPKSLPDEVVSLAVNALDACKLDLGAVSVSFGGGRARVTNITTGPSLSEEHLSLYASAIEDFAGKEITAGSSEGKKVRSPKGVKLASSEAIAEVARNLVGLTDAKAKAILKSIKG